MIITELIERLQQLQDQIGNVEVEVRNPAGDYDITTVVQRVNISPYPRETKWRVYVDA